ncbi:metal-sensitive transcriptional regulator [Alkalilimnicola sp. S0819]|uniref:metal-sensitive transcriptional regulator n=1 Tax=Alkalilimnicola sp. S0819 TaxID=2613922 RepID=UPI001261C3F2|nr:metal-sensitive transcriptional regulator [Alkalilimnicola sp. S0819]KAB7627485.1 metal-sensitive transcriptional regulator [Alkalilimnicola sp. S0819]MPQ15637.1 metal-sensing transcriptional repressor [Alkalilimnicola sp. S0819]
MARAVNAGHCEGLRLDPAVREDARRRLLSLRGHVDGILRMLDNEQVYCVDVLKQVKAVNGALNRVGELVLRSHLQEHVSTAAQRGDTHHLVDELMELLKYR